VWYEGGGNLSFSGRCWKKENPEPYLMSNSRELHGSSFFSLKLKFLMIAKSKCGCQPICAFRQPNTSLNQFDAILGTDSCIIAYNSATYGLSFLQLSSTSYFKLSPTTIILYVNPCSGLRFP
jgi:hypothetical protein